MTILRSVGFRLRPLRRGDEPALVKHANDREIARNTISVPYPYTLRHARSWITKNLRLQRHRSPESIVFAIEVQGGLVGCIGIHKVIRGHKAEIGYWLGREFRGRGIMTEAVKLVVRHAFRRLQLRRVYAFTYLWNVGSQRVLRKAGFKHEGNLRKNVKKNGRVYDDHIFSIVR